MSANKATLMAAVSVSALCGDAGWTPALAEKLVTLHPKDARLSHSYLPILRALLTSAATTLLPLSRSCVGTSYGAPYGLFLRYCRGEVYLGQRMGAEAEADFQFIVDHRGWDLSDNAYPLAHLGLARAAALTGDPAKSRKYYQEFFALWKDADPDLPILLEARREYARNCARKTDSPAMRGRQSHAGESEIWAHGQRSVVQASLRTNPHPK